MRIAAATLAHTTDDAAVEPGTVRSLSFGGTPTAEIAQGNYLSDLQVGGPGTSDGVVT